MPRLSIIVPYCQDDARFESTLVSVLENRPRDVEVLVPHDGSYQDPYQLGDEVSLLDCASATSVELLVNEALSASRSPVIQPLLPGTMVSEGWIDQPLELLGDRKIAAVSPRYVDRIHPQTVYGLDTAEIWRRGAAVEPNADAFPLMTGGFFRRRTLAALSGWREGLGITAAEVDLCLAFHALSQTTIVAEACEIQCDLKAEFPQVSLTTAKVIGSICQGYQSMLDDTTAGQICPSTLKRTIVGITSPRSVINSIGWSLGFRHHEQDLLIKNRIQDAYRQLESANSMMNFGNATDSGHSSRRAA